MTFTHDFLANEAFIRRAAAVAGPFMLKGSYLTRQYFANPAERHPNDLDFTYLGGRLGDGEQARVVLDAWMTHVTELTLDDGWAFRSFRENAFWRLIDYAMADDFPTVNTDLLCWRVGQEPADKDAAEPIAVDVSFNLPMDLPSVPLRYQPAQGPPFVVPHTAPLALQVAWKLHQTLVRPRLKDLFDLLHLLRHPDFTATASQQALAALRQECRADGTDPGRLGYLLAGNLAPLYPQQDAEEIWQYWRHQRDYSAAYRATRGFVWHSDRASFITDPTTLPTTLAEFAQQLRNALAMAGFVAAAPPAPATPENSRQPPSEPQRGFLDTLLGFFN